MLGTCYLNHSSLDESQSDLMSSYMEIVDNYRLKAEELYTRYLIRVKSAMYVDSCEYNCNDKKCGLK